MVGLSTDKKVEREPTAAMPSETAIGTPRLPQFIRFRDLQHAGVVGNWEQLRNLISDHDFPPGMLLSPNTRVWDVENVRAWLDARPVERKLVAPRGKQVA
jgi:hypothetical protein